MVEVLALRKVSQHSYVNVLELWFLLLVCGMMGAMSLFLVCGVVGHSVTHNALSSCPSAPG